MQTFNLRSGVLKSIVGNSLKRSPTQFGPQTPKLSQGNEMSMEDFLYGFAIHYGILVKDAQQARKKPIDREVCLRLYCERLYKKQNLSEHVFATVSKILTAKGAKTQLYPGEWVSAALYIYDAWFCLIIGKRYQTQFALNIPDSFIAQVDEHSSVYSQLSK